MFWTMSYLNGLKDEMSSEWLHTLDFMRSLVFRYTCKNSLNPHVIFASFISQSNLSLVVPTLCLQLPAWQSHSNMKYSLDDYAIF